jgi:hypothetical protein
MALYTLLVAAWYSCAAWCSLCAVAFMHMFWDFCAWRTCCFTIKTLRVHLMQCLVTLNVLRSVSQWYFNMHLWQTDDFRPIVCIFCAVWKSVYRSQLSNLYSVLALLGVPAVSWKKFVFCRFYDVSHRKSEDLEEPSGAGKISFTLFCGVHQKSVHIAPRCPENKYSFSYKIRYSEGLRNQWRFSDSHFDFLLPQFFFKGEFYATHTVTPATTHWNFNKNFIAFKLI